MGRKKPAPLPPDNVTSSVRPPSCNAAVNVMNGTGCLRLAATTATKIEESTGAEYMQLRPSSSAPATKAIALDGTGFSGSASMAMWVDIDSDGDLDLYLISSSSKLFRNGLKQSSSGSTPSFVLQTGAQAGSLADESGSPVHAAWGDFDNDGDMDCYVGHVNGIGDRLYVNDGGGVFSTSTIFGESGDTFDTIWYTNGVAWADFNGDG